jgi:hypothetical protein
MILGLASLLFQKILLAHWTIGFRKVNSIKLRWFIDVIGLGLICFYFILMTIEDKRCSDIGASFFIQK